MIQRRSVQASISRIFYFKTPVKISNCLKIINWPGHLRLPSSSSSVNCQKKENRKKLSLLAGHSLAASVFHRDGRQSGDQRDRSERTRARAKRILKFQASSRSSGHNFN